MKATQETEALGIQFNLVGKCYRMSPSWVEKLLLKEAWTTQEPTKRELLAIFGACIWVSHIKKEKLWHRYKVVDILKHLAKDLSEESLEQKIQLTSSQEKELNDWKTKTVENKWVQWDKQAPTKAVLWTDASEDVWAYVVEREGRILQWNNGDYNVDLGILVGETIALSKGLKAVEELHMKKVAAMVDNQALVAICNKGIARNNSVNYILSNTPTTLAAFTWVPTHIQAADPLTRGGNLAAVHTRIASAAAMGYPREKQNSSSL